MMLNRNIKMRRNVFIALLALSLPMKCFAGSFSLSPVRVELSAARPSMVIQISNLGDETITLQTQLLAWGFDGNHDTYRETDDVVLNPPIFRLEPHQKQMVR